MTFVEPFVIVEAMKKLKIAVVGVGRLGANHARIYSELKNVKLCAVCDTNPQALEKVSSKLKVKAYTDYEDLLSQKLDAVSIAVPTIIHHRVAKVFLNAGIPALIEKPITSNIQEAQDLISIAENKNAIIQVGHVERFNSAFQAIKPIIKNPRFIETHRLSPFPNRSLDIGVVLDVMIHDIDIILGLINEKIKSIDAVGVKVLTQKEDIANARITFQNGCVCNLTASRVSDEYMRKIRIFLENTYISLDYNAQEAFIYKKELKQITKDALPIEKEEPLKKEIESFVDCVINKKRPIVSGEGAKDALEAALKIQNQIWKNIS